MSQEPHVSDWRRHTAGDLTSAFRFDRPPGRFPRDNANLRYRATVSKLRQVRDNPAPGVPQGPQAMP